MIDVSCVIGTAVAIMIAVVIYKLLPAVEAFLPEGALFLVNWFAGIVVKAVESEYESGEGAEKREEAFRRINEALDPLICYMNKHGYTISAEHIYEAIQAAWIKLDLAEISAGVKRLSDYDDPNHSNDPDENVETE